MTPVEELRAAAARIREVAQAASPGPWGVHVAETGIRGSAPYAWLVRLDGQGAIAERVYGGTAEDLTHTALWNPVVAAAVADLLDVMERVAAFAAERGYPTNEQTAAALTVARAINGEVDGG